MLFLQHNPIFSISLCHSKCSICHVFNLMKYRYTVARSLFLRLNRIILGSNTPILKRTGKQYRMQCKPLDTWSTHSSEAKRCVVNILTSSDSIIRATFSRYWMSLKCFAERNASFTNGRQINVLCSAPTKEWLTTVILCLLNCGPVFRGKSFRPRSVSPQ